MTLIDYLVKAQARDNTLRIYVARTTDLVEAARRIHDTWPAATAAFGRTLTATLLMGALLKEDQDVTVQIDGNGPIGKIIAVANAIGQVKGVLTHPQVHQSTPLGKLDVGGVVGDQGFLRVTKDLKVRDLFTSSVALQTGEIGDDFSYYFLKSEQIPSAVGLGVLVDTNGQVISAGGYIVQAMPGASDETLTLIEDKIRTLPPVSTLIQSGQSPEQIVQLIAGNDVVWNQSMPVGYRCDCSRKRFETGLIALGKVELDDIIRRKESIETVCQFCRKTYDFSIDELSALIEKATII
jgi:molecular chaperone Hsp33